jgi:hypothetical protein
MFDYSAILMKIDRSKIVPVLKYHTMRVYGGVEV